MAGRADLESARLREEGFRQALTAAGVDLDPGLVRVGDYLAETAEEPARRLLDMQPGPTAIFAANDVMALQMMHVAASRGLKVPDDLSVIGFDNIPESALSKPGLTTIEQPIQEMGFQAVRALIAVIEGTFSGPRQLILPTSLVVRGSCRRIDDDRRA